MESVDAATAEAAGIANGARAVEHDVGHDVGHDAGAGPEVHSEASIAVEDVGSRSWWSLSRPSLLTLAAGLLITAALAVAALELYEHNETRLLRLRARELSLVLSTAVPSLQTPLASAAELADATHGNPQKFRAFMAPLVGPGRAFTSASLWRGEGSHAEPRVVVGTRPALTAIPGEAQKLFTEARLSGQLVLTGLLAGSPPRIGYAYALPGAQGGYIAYAENPLPASRRSQLAESTGFGDLNYALYLGRSRSQAPCWSRT